MSAFNHSDIAEMVRRRFNLPEGDELRFIPLVDSALRQLAYDVAKDPSLRAWLMTDPSFTTASLSAAGVADLTALVASPRILLECLQYGEITPPAAYASDQPFRMIDNSGQGQLAGAYDALVYKAWVEGDNLFTKSPDNNVTPLTGTIAFRVPYWPTISQLPEPLVKNLVWGNYWISTPLTEVQNAA